MMPDKVYVMPMKTSENQDTFVGLAYELDKLLIDKIEYIRKDALLEKLRKAAESYKKRSDEGELVWQNMCGINEAIDILNEM